MHHDHPTSDNQPWEQATVRVLYSEYAAICSQHATALRPATITLMDSDSHWGSWSPLTRTISLSRKLVHGHPWHQVLGILRHEMAHQLVTEGTMTLPPAPAGTPHDERFRAACRQLGVPHEFARASADLLQHSLDWRDQKRDEPTERLLDKVRKLLALATSSNEHEALLAMSKVRELYAKYNLEQVADPTPRFAHIVIPTGKQRIEKHIQVILGILVGHFFVQVIYTREYNPKTYGRTQSFKIIGTQENVLMAEYVYHFLVQQTATWARRLTTTVRGVSYPATRQERASFKLGILHGFQDKLKHAEREPQATQPQRTPGHPSDLTVVGQALQKFKQDRALDDYLDELHPRLKTRRTSSRFTDDDAYLEGHAVGKTLTLHRAMTTEHGNLGRLLPER